MIILIYKKQIKALLFYVIFTLIISVLLCFSIRINKEKSTVNTHDNEGKPVYLIYIYIDENKLYLFENEKCIKKYTIASGKPGWPSPIGNWKIIEKSNWGEGFGGRWLGLNVIWGKYGIHGTTEEHSIGSNASHGCIRMFNRDIKELYNIVPVGTPVIIRNGNFGPFGTGFRELIPGDRGADVLAVQQKLKNLGYFKGNETGIYEDDLKNALHTFQKAKKLKVKDNITLEDYYAMGFSEFE